MYVDVADIPAYGGAALYKIEGLWILCGRLLGDLPQAPEHLSPVFEVPAGQLSQHEGVDRV